MILQALYDYYKRKKDSLPDEGFELKEIKFIIVIDKEGNFKDLIDTRENKKGRKYNLPKAIGRSGSKSWQTTFLLWDHYGYVLAHPKDPTEKAIEMAKKQNNIFIQNINDLPEYVKNDEGVNAVKLFYDKNQMGKVKQHPNWTDCEKIAGCNLTFQLDGDERLIPERKVVKEYQQSLLSSGEATDDEYEKFIAPCIITGESGVIARLHNTTPILGSQSTAKIVSFQRNSGFDSYGKEQAYNAPVSLSAEAAYSTALNHLLKSPKNRVLIGDTTIVFWADKPPKIIDMEDIFPWVISARVQENDDPDKGVKVIETLYKSVRTGKLPLEEQNRFYVLGLSPNVARISVRLWKMGTVKEFGEKIIQHFDDLKIIRSSYEPEHLSLNRILTSIVFQYKMENVPPNLSGSVIESILDGKPYPVTLLQQCIRRIRAESAKKDNNGRPVQNVTRTRAAILKAYINRYLRFYNLKEKEITMALDPTNNNPGYRLGRLFAVLEKIQENANPGINATIKDRYYGAASSSPVSVFSQLLKLKNHHLAKLKKGEKIYFEKLVGDIMDGISEFPSHLTMNDQAYFSIGYYHQRQEFYKKKEESVENEN